MNILEYCTANRRDYTYIGIGSNNRTSVLAEFTPDLDQILPCFLNAVQDKTIRVIHFDPAFKTNFLTEYFASKGFVQQDTMLWTTPEYRIEAIIIPQYFDDNIFLHSMIEMTLAHSAQLVVQQFTGGDFITVLKNSYLQCNLLEREYIEQNILFDITYGTSQNYCDPHMTEYGPILDPNGRFYNFLLYTDEKLLETAGKNANLDMRINAYLLTRLFHVLNDDHVNYRRVIRGEPPMFDTPFVTSEDIMQNMLTKIKTILTILEKIGGITPAKWAIFNRCSTNYRSVDMYKWYSEMTTLYKA